MGLPTKPLPFWQRPVVYRTAIGLYILLVLAIAGVTFVVSSLDVQTSLYVRGQPDLQVDRHHALRGAFHHAPTGEVLDPEELTIHLVDGDAQQHPVEWVDGVVDQDWPNPTYRIPSETAQALGDGPYHLRIAVEHERVDPLEADFPVVLSEARRPATLSDLPWPRVTRRDDEPRLRGQAVRPVDSDQETSLSLAIAPANGELTRGLPQDLHIRTYDADSGEPLVATVELELVEGLLESELPRRVRSDRFGLADVAIRPATNTHLRATVTPRADGDDPPPAVEFDIHLRVVASQYAIATGSPVVAPGETIDAVVHSVFRDRPFMVDLYDHEGDRLADTLSLQMSDYRGAAQFIAPDVDHSSPLLRVQTYQSIYGTQRGWDQRYVLLSDHDSTAGLRQLVRELYAWIGDRTGSEHHIYLAGSPLLDEADAPELRGLAAAALEELPRRFQLPPVVLNTRQDDREEMDLWREEIRSDLQLMMGLTLFVGVVVATYFVVLGIRRQRRERQMMEDVALEGDAILEADEASLATLERWSVLLQGAIVFLTLIAFALGILIVVSYL